jgi:hypothetical protein
VWLRSRPGVNYADLAIPLVVVRRIRERFLVDCRWCVL